MPHPRSRRSTDIIAPGFGTQTDLERLARDLSEGSNVPISASFVNSMMNSRGRGRRRREAEPEDPEASAAPTSSAWADFMQEEGMDSAAKRPRAADGGDDDKTEQTADEDEEGKKPATTSTAAEGDSKSRAYELDFAKKKSKPTAGFLVQAGTLNSAIVGRGTIFSFCRCHRLLITSR
jgi:hypothetical protein